MSNERPVALIVSTATPERRLLTREAKRHHFETTTATSEKAARKALAAAPALVLIDLDQIGHEDGLALVSELDESDTEVLVTSENPSVMTVVKAFRHGAMDFVLKPFGDDQVRNYFDRVSRSLKLSREVLRLRSELRRMGRFGSMVGISPPMQRVYDLISKVAPTDAAVLIVGETGTGKELVSRTLHDLSHRVDEPFLPVNSGAIQPSLFESELFGHEKGAFTGASERHKGIFEQADGGSVFLDEVTEMPADVQVKLLRFLEDKRIRRVGAARTIKSDVRIIAATNRDPGEAIAEGTLREDVFYRLATFTVQLPPLRERGDDIVLLADYFLAQLNEEHETTKQLSPTLREELVKHSWPGNVRELRNTIRRAYVLADEVVEPPPIGGVGVLPSSGTEVQGPASGVGVEVGDTIAAAERKLIEATLESCDNDKKQAAKTLGISLKTLYTRLKTYAPSP